MNRKIIGWMSMLAALAVLEQAAHGASTCISARFHDNRDLGCHQAPDGAGNPPSKPCPECNGMPRWWVSEPYLNLWVADEPLSYRTSSGQEMTFRFTYRQRFMLPQKDEVANVTGHAGGAKVARTYGMSAASWGNNWLSEIVCWDSWWDAQFYCIDGSQGRVCYQANFPKYSQGWEAMLYTPEGGVLYFVWNPGGHITNQPTALLTDPVSGATLQPQSAYPTTANPSPDPYGIYWGNSTDGFKISYPDGKQDIYGLNDTLSGTVRLTERIDAQGRITRLGYEKVAHTNFNGFPRVDYYGLRLLYVVDHDLKTNTFRYDIERPEHIWEVTEIDDPYGRNAQIGYSGGVLSSITDSAGLTSSFQYQTPTPEIVPNWCAAYDGTNYYFVMCGYTLSSSISSGWITSMTTPYGTTSFKYYESRDSDTNALFNFQQRAIYVSEPGGASQLYCFAHHVSGLPTTASSPSVPGNSFDDGTAGGNHPTLDYRNTFHWNRRQTTALSATVQSYLAVGNVTNAVNALTLADFRKAGMKHWLWGNDDVSISESISSERDPSPDAAGQIEGLRTWYDYAGKPSPEREGTNPQVTAIARLLPGGTSQYTRYNYLTPWLVRDSAQSYSKPDGSIGELTNTFTYAANNIDLLAISNSVGQFANFAYNTNHQVLFITNALKYVTALIWDGTTHNLTNVAYPNGKTISLGYGADSLVSQINVNPNGLLVQIPSRTNGMPQTIYTSGTGLPSLWRANTFDGLNRLTSTVYPDGTYISNRFDKLDLSAARDRLGNWTYFGHDALQHLTAITNANNAVTLLGWCGCGALTSITDPLTNTTVLNYNNQGLVTNVLFPDSSSLTYTFDLANRLIGIKDGLNRGLTYGYNNSDLVTTVSNAYGRLESIVSDALGRPINATDANNVTVTNTFDLLNRLTARTWQDGIGEGFLYSTNGLIAHTNRDRQVTRYLRDGAGRTLAVTNANMEVTQFGYNALDEITSLVDGLNHPTTWSFDEYGRVTNKVDALSHEVFRYAYNANGWITNRWTPEKGNTGYTYDNVGNLKSILYPQLSILYAYDPLNRLTNMVDAAGTTIFSYTATGQLKSEDGPWTGDTISFGYSEQLRQSMSLAQPGGSWSQTYGYDSARRLQTLTSPAGAFGYGYRSQLSSLVSQLSLPNGAYITNHFDSLARLDGTALMNHWGHVLDGYAYKMDPLGLRTNIFRDFGLTTNAVSIGYDKVGQITSWTAVESNGAPRWNERFGWTYDKAQNLQFRTNNTLTQAFMVDALNQLTNITRSGALTLSGSVPAPMTSVTVNGQSAQVYGDFTFARTNLTLANGLNSFTNVAQNPYGVRSTNTLNSQLPATLNLSFDLNGNLTNAGTRSFFYDSENQLTNVTVAGAWKSEFVYDGLNRRRIQRDYSWAGSAWSKTNEVRFIYDRLLPIQERDASGNVLVTYTRGPDMSRSLQGAGGIGGLLARTDNSLLSSNSYFLATTYYHADGAGNVTALINAYQHVVARYLFTPFGKQIGQWGPLADANVMRFSSMFAHRQSGLIHYTYRDYEPNLQQFLTADPIGEAGGIALHGFVGNNPASNLDPLGLDFSLWSGGGTAYGNWTDNGPNSSINAPVQASDPTANQQLLGTAGSMVPGVGEAMDVSVLTDPESAWWEKSLAGASLTINMAADGFLPNIGGFLKSAKAECKVVKKIPREKLKYAPRERGKAPIGADGKPVELHHTDQRLGNDSPRKEMTQTDHRGKGNFSQNHPNTGQMPSTVNRVESSQQHTSYWEREWDNGAFDDLPPQP